jgi:hypothetical protein
MHTFMSRSSNLSWNIINTTLFILICTIGTYLGSPVSLNAQGLGVQILPAFIEDAAGPGSELSAEMTVRNLSQIEQTFYLAKKDIAGVRDDATPIFAEEGMEQTGFEISSWITISEEPIILAPGASVKVPFSITVPQDATPGSHFGGVFVTSEPPRLRETGAAVGYEVGSIVSIRIRGDVVENARIRSFATDKSIYNGSTVTFTTRVENSGNVLIRPRGPLEIQNMFGKRVGVVTVNDAKGGVFPRTTRAYDTTWQSEDLLIGRYEAVVSLIYGEEGNETTVSAVVSFWVLPFRIIAPILGILAFISLAVYFGVRAHIKKTLRAYEAQGGRVRYRRRRDAGVTKLTMVALGLLLAVTLFLVILLVIFA